jgi:hypothetical protein
MMEDTNLNEIFDSFQRYESDDIWDKFLQDEFFRYDRPTRVQVLTGFDKLMQQETRPNRTTAMWLNRQREAVAMHKMLERGGR